MKKIIFSSRIWKFIRNIAPVVITLGLLSYLLHRLKPNRIAEAIINIRLWVIFLAIAISITMYVLKTTRWYYILRKLDIKLNFLEVLKLVLIGSFGASVTPAKMGDVIRALYLAKWSNIKETTSFFSAILDRTMDLMGVGVFSLIALPFFAKQLEPITKWAIAGGMAIVLLVVLIMFNAKIVKIFGTFLLKIRKKKVANTFDNNGHHQKRKESSNVMKIVDDFYSHLSILDKKNYVVILAITFAFWLLLGLQVSLFLCFMADVKLSFQFFLTISGIMSIAATVSLIPISISGIGIRDATITVLVFYSVMIKGEIAFSASLLQTALNMVIPGIIGGFILLHSRRKEKAVRKKKKNLIH